MASTKNTTKRSGARVGTRAMTAKNSNAGSKRRYTLKDVPRSQIDLIVGNLHVGTPDEEVAADIRKRCEGSDMPAPVVTLAVKYAVDRHQKNRGVYSDVMSGRAGRARRTKREDGHSTGAAGFVKGDAKAHLDRRDAWRRDVRAEAGAGPSLRIDVVAGRSAPRVEGETNYYANKGGTRIDHPNAYRKKGFNMVYHPSTRRVVVGADWKPEGFASGKAGLASGRSKTKAKRMRVKATCACAATAVVRKKSKKSSRKK